MKFKLNVVLVRPLYERNIGACSRAMSNFGADQMILIGPQCEITFEAQQAAATGQDGLQNRKVYQDWDEFFKNEPQGLRIGTTTKDGRTRQVRDFEECLNWIKTESPTFKEDPSKTIPVYLIFGPEDWGLSSDDLELTHFNCSLPTYGENVSMNLAQAVLLALYIVRRTWGGQKSLIENQSEESAKSDRQNVFPEQLLKDFLVAMGLQLEDRGVSAYTVMKRLMLHSVPTEKEIRILEMVLNQGIRKLNEYNSLRKTKQ